MDEITYAYGTAAVIIGYFLAQVASRRFDPFAPTWLFLVGYLQIYVVQAITYHAWAVSARGKDLVASADWRALWAVVWFLIVYHVGPGRRVSQVLPRPPRRWSPVLVAFMAPPLILWGLYCSGIALRSGSEEAASAEASLFRSFPFVLMVAAILLIVTGRNMQAPRPAFTAAGLAVSFLYAMIWMFNGKRSHSLIAVLATVCAYYITRLKRPSWPVLFSTAFAGTLVVAIAIGWRYDHEHPRRSAVSPHSSPTSVPHRSSTA